MVNLKNKKVSILTCFYERPSFADLMIHSIKNQTFVKKYPENVEIVIADDSSDRYKLDIDYYKKELKGVVDDIKYIRIDNEKMTIGKKRNMLMKNAKYAITIVFDDDDYYFPCYIEYSLKELVKKRKSIVTSNSMLFCFTEYGYSKRSINCISKRQGHEGCMTLVKSHWERTGGFNENGFGEGAKLIDGFEEKVDVKLDIGKLMVCVCHPRNSCNKLLFLKSGLEADYDIPEEAKRAIEKAINHPLYTERKRFVFKYPTRGRPDVFKNVINRYLSYLSNNHEYRFVISIDNDDKTMNNPDIINFLNEIRKKVVLEYYIEPSKNKVDAINRNIRAARGDILFLISDDMIPVQKNFDEIIVRDFETYFPDFDGMLNYNDGFRKDWPALCTLTIFGWKYYDKFKYIYNPSYESVYCDREQTDVGRLLNKIKDIDNVIVEHQWSNAEYQDDLRKKTEGTDYYSKDHHVYVTRKQNNFGLVPKNNVNEKNKAFVEKKRSTPQVAAINTDVKLSILIPTIPSRIDSFKKLFNKIQKQIEKYQNSVEVLSIFDTKTHTVGYKRNKLLEMSKGQFITFIDDDDSISDDYIDEILRVINTHGNDIDVIAFKQLCSLDNGKTTFVIDADINHKANEPIPYNSPWKSEYKRSLWHWCVFNSDKCKNIEFPDKTGFEDQEWLTKVIPTLSKQVKINKTLYHYTFSIEHTEGQAYLDKRSFSSDNVETGDNIDSVEGKRILVTACDSNYFNSCVTLISSIHRLSYDVVDAIVVYDLGLAANHIDVLNKLENVIIVTKSYIETEILDSTFFDGFLEPKQFAWKPLFLLHAAKYGETIFYLDSGGMFFGSILPIFEYIERAGIWLSLDTDHKNREWTHPECVNIMKATDEELNANQLLAGVTGYNKNDTNALKFLNDALSFAKIKNCITGLHYSENYGPGVRGHRHDQSIMSILAKRYKLPTVAKNKFLEWRSIQHVHDNKSLVFIHHKSVIYTRNLKLKKTGINENIPKTLLTFDVSEYDIIQSDKIMNKCNEINLPNLNYRKTEFLFGKGNWRGMSIGIPDYTVKNNVIVSGHSGFPIDEHRYTTIYNHIINKGGSLKKWYAQNPMFENEHLVRIPLGLTNDCDDSSSHRIFGNTEAIVENSGNFKSIENIVYMNFNVNNHEERKTIWALYEGFNWVTKRQANPTLEGRKSFLEDVFHHMFVLSPRGTGNDTHRLWETLYMRTVPIVKRIDDGLYDYEDLPILYIDDWNSVTDERILTLEYDRIINCYSYNLNKMKTSFWNNQIEYTARFHDDNNDYDLKHVSKNTRLNLYTDYEVSLEYLHNMRKYRIAHVKTPNEKYKFHIYSELVNFNQLLALQSYLATQDLKHTELHIWSEYNIKTKPYIFPYTDCKNLIFHIYDPYELAKDTILENRKDLLDRNDKKFYLKSDIFRLLALYKYGGCFYDHDIVLTNDFEPLFDLEFAYQWGSELDYDHEGFCATVIGARKGSNNIRLMLEQIANTPPEQIIDESTVFGKDMFAKVQKQLSGFHIFPSAWFNTEWSVNQKYPGLSPKIQLGWFNDKLENSVHMFKDAFCWHYHNGTKKDDTCVPYSKMALCREFTFDRLRSRNIGKMVILTHLGFGDHLLCNSIIRYYANVSPYVATVTKQKNAMNVARMFGDLKNVRILQVEDDSNISPNIKQYGDNGSTELRKKLMDNKYKLLALGFHKQIVRFDDTQFFIQQLYKDALLDGMLPKSMFSINRSLDIETHIYKRYGDKQKYIVIHDSPERNFRIDRSKIVTDLPVFDMSSETFKQYSMFDLITLIDNAAEVHVVDSCFLWIIELQNICVGRRFFHEYVRNSFGYNYNGILSNDWVYFK